MVKSLEVMVNEVRGACGDLRDEILLPICYTRTGQAWPVVHFAKSQTCSVIKQTQTYPAGTQMGRNLPGSFTVANVAIVGMVPYCPECFTKCGLSEILRWAKSSDRASALRKFLMRYEIVTLTRRCEHVRNGLVQEHAFGGREAPVVLRKVAKLWRDLAPAGLIRQDHHATAVVALEEAVAQLNALVNPGDGSWALDRLRTWMRAGGHSWVVLDETPTIMAVEHGMNHRVRQIMLAPELIAGLRVSEANTNGVVLYGPRFAIDYLQRAWADTLSYIVATTEEDAEVARMAGRIWDVDGGIPDLFAALDAARRMVGVEVA